MKNLINDEKGSVGYIIIILLITLAFAGMIFMFFEDMYSEMNITTIYDNTQLANLMSDDDISMGYMLTIVKKYVLVFIFTGVGLFYYLRAQEISNRGG